MKTALITGGSSGLGYALSEKFAEEGYRILWVSKPQDELERGRNYLTTSFPKVELHMLSLDLVPDDAPAQLMKWVEENGWEVDVLVNNAGFGSYGFLLDTVHQVEVAMMKLHMISLYSLTRLFLDKMEKRGHGLIINISSNSSFQPVPKFATYASSKAFVLRFGRAISEELRMKKSKVRLLTVCPAALNDTAFQKRADMEKVKTFQGLATTSKYEVVKDVWKAIERNKSFVISGWKMRFLNRLSWILPYGVQMALVRREVEEMP
ncbi:MAG: SDR family NAD(P)-dependent oxidoreductase [Bacteroidota bacterium]